MEMSANYVEKFMGHVSKRPGCWPWTGRCTTRGYGRFRMAGRDYAAHRVAWEISVGAIPEGMCVLHRCDNPRCVNVKHLFIGTPYDNNRDRSQKGRSCRGEGHWSCRLSSDDVVSIRRRSAAGETQRAIARRFGVHQATVWRAIHGVNWEHIDR